MISALVGHLAGDYLAQNDWMALNKPCPERLLSDRVCGFCGRSLGIESIGCWCPLSLKLQV